MPPKSKTKRCNVLVVEDDQCTRDLLSRLLEDEGHTVCAAATIAEAISMLEGQDAAILDMELPDGFGHQIVELIYQQKRPIRVAICSGTHDDRLLQKAVAHGAELIMRKPLDVAQMMAWLTRDA